VHPARVLRTATFRLSALYVLLFATSVAVLGVIAYMVTAATLERRLDARIAGEMTALKAAFTSGGLAALAPAVRAHQQTLPAGSLEYLLLGPGGERLGGKLPIVPAQLGWSNVEKTERDGDVSRRRVLAAALSNGARLAIGADREQIEDVEQAIFDGFTSAFGAVILLGTIGGIALSLAFLKRVETIRRTAEAIIAGDLTQRVPVRGTGDDLDRLSVTLNHMLDRIAELMESLRHISADIAHDLKTPIARLRQQLERTQTHAQSAEEHDVAVGAAIVHIDEILAIFGSLLRIAQIEAGTRRSGFRDLDLSAVFTNVIEAFTPAAEDAGKCLSSEITPGIRTAGDRDLLTQMLANLVENAIRHTAAGTLIDVTLASDGDGIVGAVTDNGPGAPAHERERIFQRFYRLERSRLTPGSGLGLSLVKAVADLHDITLEVRDAEPGLQIVMRFPETRQPGATSADPSARLENSYRKGRT
jgi:signal transduction histidine kinase